MRKTLSLTLLCTFLGFVLALQFGASKEASPRDTRDIYELQDDLTKAQKQHVLLNTQISQADQLLQGYQDDNTEHQMNTMKDELEKEKELAGETQKTGEGILLTIDYLAQGILEEDDGLTADLIRRLVNELNLLGATDIAISNERLTNTSPIRMVHDQVYVNDRPLPSIPIKISVLTSNPTDFKKRLEVSESMDEFARNGLIVSVKVENTLKLPAFNDNRPIDYMEPIEVDK